MRIIDRSVSIVVDELGTRIWSLRRYYLVGAGRESRDGRCEQGFSHQRILHALRVGDEFADLLEPLGVLEGDAAGLVRASGVAS
jgi:hypothetical protein